MYLDVFFTTSPMEEWEEWDGISMCEKKIAAHFLTISYIYIYTRWISPHMGESYTNGHKEMIIMGWKKIIG